MRVREDGKHGQILCGMRQAETGAASGLDVQLRQDGQYGEILRGMWETEARIGFLDLRVRYAEYRKILYELRETETGSRAVL